MREKDQQLAEIERILTDKLLLDVDAESDLVESGVLDSVNVVRLLAAIEQHFGIMLPLDGLTIDNLRSIRAIGESIDQWAEESVEEMSAAAMRE